MVLNMTNTQMVDVKSFRSALQAYKDKIEAQREFIPLAPLLPLLLQLRGQPYSLKWSHFMFAPMFMAGVVPRQLMFKTGRQTSKSTSIAASQILRAYLQNFYNILTVMPLFEQVRKFSSNYVRPFITGSPLKSKLVGDLKTDSVLQRSIGTQSNLYYSYSSGDPSRIRGIPADEICLDEFQDFDLSDLPIIESCTGASPFKILRFTGTPKTFDNPMQLSWDDSSQAIWHIDCHHTGCKKTNRCSVQGDLLKMLGDDTLICAFCGRPVNSRAGYYVHDFPERRMLFPGYHVPQPILPMHYESPKDWFVLKETQRNKPTYAFYNEVLGESFDVGAKILTADELHAACTVDPIDEPEQMPRGQYVAEALGIDWGGRGKEKTSDTDDFISNTAMALGGMLPDGTVEIKWLFKVPYVVDLSEEAKIAVRVAEHAHVEWLALDYGGQGNVQESQIRANGWPPQRVVPFTYTSMTPAKPIVFYNPPRQRGVRSSYSLDKARSLLLLCELIKRGMVRLPKSDKYINDHLRDFLNIYEESIENPSGSPRRLVKRLSRRTDDIVHAINFVVMTLYHSTGQWPQIAEAFVDHPHLLRQNAGM